MVFQEEKKILFYHPQDTDKDQKIKGVGLSEAIIKFTNTFNPFEECKSFRTQKTCQVYFEPEPDFWMVMVSVHCFGLRGSLGHSTAFSL